MEKPESVITRPANRRSFLKGGILAGGAAATIGAGLFGRETSAYGEDNDEDAGLTRGDVAILRFLAAAELIESDLWVQYAELGGVTDGTQNNYQLAFQFLDGDGSQYITSNALDEISHAAFLNAYLESKGADPVNFDEFRILRGSQATGAQDIGRLTNLMHLDVDTSWYIRYRSTTNPDFGATYPSNQNQQPAGHPQNGCRLRGCKPHPGNRKHGSVSLRLHRTRWIQSLSRSGSESNEPRSFENCLRHWRR
jgi:hypothetical protein